MDAGGRWGDRILRNDEAPDEIGDQTATQTLHDAPVLYCPVFQLLLLVGLHQLLERRFLLPVVPSVVLLHYRADIYRLGRSFGR